MNKISVKKFALVTTLSVVFIILFGVVPILNQVIYIDKTNSLLNENQIKNENDNTSKQSIQSNLNSRYISSYDSLLLKMYTMGCATTIYFGISIAVFLLIIGIYLMYIDIKNKVFFYTIIITGLSLLIIYFAYMMFTILLN